MAKGASYRDAADRFKHSISTICKYFIKAVDALVILSHDIIRPHYDLLEVPPEVENNSLYWPYFKDAIGALNGTHIEAVVGEKDGVPFRGCHQKKSWNVLACCSFDRIFTFINMGWEGSAHDIIVWRDSLTNSKFCFPHPPKGKYYLVDSGYPNTLGYLSPISHPNVRNHVPEYKHAPPSGIFEHFNYRHSSLRITVEMAFGQLKRRWKVLKNMPQMTTNYQLSIIVSAFTLHNFIRMHKLGIPVIQNQSIQGRTDSNMDDKERKKLMDKVRTKIAKKIGRDIGVHNDLDNDTHQDDTEVNSQAT